MAEFLADESRGSLGNEAVGYAPNKYFLCIILNLDHRNLHQEGGEFQSIEF